MSNFDAAKLDSMMGKIRALLARADHPNTPEAEADSARAMADKLMRKYRIEESEAIADGTLNAEQFKPGSKVVDVCPADSPFYLAYWTLMAYACGHTGVRYVSKWATVNGVYTLCATLVGYEADIRFTETIFMNARLVFGERMEPKVDPNASDADNVYRLRSAGIERIKIAKMMGFGDTGSATAKVTNLYKRACKERGEAPLLTGRGMSVTAFREAYIDGFKSEFYMHLRRARLAAEADSSAGALVLHDRQDRVNEAFYNLFPDQRPDAVAKASKGVRRARYTAADRRADERRWSAAGQAGTTAGRRAATEVNVNQNQPRKRLND